MKKVGEILLNEKSGEKREFERECVHVRVCERGRERACARARERERRREILLLRPSASLSSLLIIWFTNSTYHVTRFLAPRLHPVLPSPRLPAHPFTASPSHFPRLVKPHHLHIPSHAHHSRYRLRSHLLPAERHVSDTPGEKNAEICGWGGVVVTDARGTCQCAGVVQ
jgi:hypothetical protein